MRSQTLRALRNQDISYWLTMFLLFILQILFQWLKFEGIFRRVTYFIKHQGSVATVAHLVRIEKPEWKVKTRTECSQFECQWRFCFALFCLSHLRAKWLCPKPTSLPVIHIHFLENQFIQFILLINLWKIDALNRGGEC